MTISLIGLVIFLMQLWAIVDLLGGDYSTVSKVIWTLLIAFLPIIGILLYVLFKRK